MGWVAFELGVVTIEERTITVSEREMPESLRELFARQFSFGLRSLNMWSPSRCRMASTIVSRFLREVTAGLLRDAAFVTDGE